MVNKTVLITGANGGIGSAVARTFLENDATSSVWLGVHVGRDQAEALAAEYPGRCQIVTLDVTVPASWESALTEIQSAEQVITVLVNNAGSHCDGLLATMSDSSWSSMISSHLDGTFYGCRAVLRGMIGERWGRIINISSLSALHCPAGQANYAAAKAGVLAMGSALSKEVGRLGITVNAVCPGYVETEALAEMPEAARKASLARIPVRRFGLPAEVADAVFYLAREKSAYINGTFIRVDGGLG